MKRLIGEFFIKPLLAYGCCMRRFVTDDFLLIPERKLHIGRYGFIAERPVPGAVTPPPPICSIYTANTHNI